MILSVIITKAFDVYSFLAFTHLMGEIMSKLKIYIYWGLLNNNMARVPHWEANAHVL